MDHDYIDQSNLVDRYLMGKLPAEEGERFEEHFINCPECTKRLKTTSNFLHDMRLLTIQQATQAQPAPQPARQWQASGLLSQRPLLWTAIGLLLFMTAGAAYLLTRVQRLQSEVDEARIAASEAEHRYEEEHKAALSGEKTRQETEQKLAEKVQELEEIQKQSPPLPTGGGWSQPAINVPVFALKSVRGGSQSAIESVNEITLPRSHSGFLVSIALEGEGPYKGYRVTIAGANNRPIREMGGLKPDRYNALSIGFPSDFFQPGNYLLKVEGITEEGKAIPISNYPIHIKKVA